MNCTQNKKISPDIIRRLRLCGFNIGPTRGDQVIDHVTDQPPHHFLLLAALLNIRIFRIDLRMVFGVQRNVFDEVFSSR